MARATGELGGLSLSHETAPRPIDTRCPSQAQAAENGPHLVPRGGAFRRFVDSGKDPDDRMDENNEKPPALRPGDGRLPS